MTEDSRFEELLESLDVMGQLTENRRLCSRNGDVDIEPESYFQGFKRLYYGEDRWNDLSVAERVIREAISRGQAMITKELNYLANTDICRRTSRNSGGSGSIYSAIPFLEKDKNLRQFGRLSTKLEQAARQIECLIVTYEYDKKYCAHVRVLVNSVDEKLREMDLALQIQEQMRQTQQRQKKDDDDQLDDYSPVIMVSSATCTTEDDDDDEKTQEEHEKSITNLFFPG